MKSNTFEVLELCEVHNVQQLICTPSGRQSQQDAVDFGRPATAESEHAEEMKNRFILNNLIRIIVLKSK